MAKKDKSEEIDFDNWDDFGFEDDFGFDEDAGFDGPSPSGRNPVLKVTGSFFNGIKQAIFRRDAVSSVLKKTLPKSYSTAFDGVADTAEDLHLTYDKISKEASDSLSKFKQENKESVEWVGNKLPERFGKKVNSWANNIRGTSNRYDGDSDEMQTAATLSGIFGEQARTANAEKQTELASEANTHTKVQTEIALSGNSLLANMARDISKIVSYQDNIGVNFQRKQLEVQLQHLFVSRKHLELAQQQSGFYTKSLEAIAHNTGLPDAVKVNTHELLQQEWSKQFWGEMSQPILTKLRPIRKKILTQFRSKIVEGIRTISDFAGMAASGGISSLATGEEMGGSTTDMIASMVGEKVGEMAIKTLSEKIGDKLKETGYKHDEIESGDKLLKWMQAQVPTYIMNEVVEGRTGHAIIDRIAEFGELGSLAFRRNERIMSNRESVLDKGAVFDIRTRQTITEIIPQLLSRIHLEVHKFNGGDLSSPIKYDWKTQSWTTESKHAEEFIEQNVYSYSQYTTFKQREDKLLTAIDPNGKLPTRLRTKIINDLREASVKGKSISLYDYYREGSHYYDREIADWIATELGIDDTVDISENTALSRAEFALKASNKYKDADTALGETRNYLASSGYTDNLGKIVKYAQGNDIRELTKYGWITVDKRTGEYKLDHVKYLAWLMDKGSREEVERKWNPDYQKDLERKANKPLPLHLPIEEEQPPTEKVNGIPVSRNIKEQLANYPRGKLFTKDSIFVPVTTEEDLTPPDAKATDSKKSSWFNGLRGKFLAGGLLAGGMALPATSMAAVNDMAMTAMPSINMMDGSSMSLIVGGTLAASAVAGSLLGRNKVTIPSRDKVYTPATNDKPIDNSKINGEIRSTTSSSVNTTNSHDVPVSRTDIILNAIHDSINKNTVKSEVNTISTQLTTITDMLSKGVAVNTLGFKLPTLGPIGKWLSTPIKGLWDGTKSIAQAPWNFVKGIFSKENEISSFFGRRGKDFGNLTGWAKDRLFGKEATKEGEKDITGIIPWLIDKAGSGARNTFDAGTATFKGGLSIARKMAFNVRSRLLEELDTDVYVQGDANPRIYWIKLKAGHYRDQATGEVIKSIRDIKGNIIDENGNVVLSVDDIKNGLYDKNGKKLDRVIGLATELMGLGINKAMDLGVAGVIGAAKGAWWLTKESWNLIGKGFTWAGSKLGIDSLKDKLDKWKSDEKWSNIFSFGSWNNSAKQLSELQSIRKLLEERLAKPKSDYRDSDNDGDRDGGVKDIIQQRLAAKQADKEIEKDEKPKDTTPTEKSEGFGGKIASFLGSASGLLGKGIMGVLKLALPTLIGGMILKYVKNKWFGNSEGATDKNGNAISPDDPRLDPSSPLYDKELAEAAKPGLFKQLAGKAFNSWDNMDNSYAKWGVAGAAGLGTYKLATNSPKLAWGATKMAYQGAKWGVKKGGQMLAGRLAAGAATSLATSAAGASTGAIAGSGIGALAAAALPWIAGAAAVGLAIYGGYKLYKWYKSKNDVYNFVRLRMAGYGYEFDDEKHVSALLNVEEALLPHIRFGSDGIAKLDDSVTMQSVMDMFGVSAGDEKNALKWREYFLKRFLPVFISFVSICKRVTGDIDLSKMDTDVTGVDAEMACDASFITATTNNAYTVMTSPFPDESKVDFDYDDVVEVYNIVRSKLQEDTRDGKNAYQKQKERDERKQAVKEKLDKNNGYGSTKYTEGSDKLEANAKRLADYSHMAPKDGLPPLSIRSPELMPKTGGLIDALLAKNKSSNTSAGANSSVMSGLLGGYINKPQPVVSTPTGGGVVASSADGIVAAPMSESSARDAVSFAKQFSKSAGTITGTTPAQTAAIAADLARTESGFNQRIVNKSGYMGLYQVGGQALADIGLMKLSAGKVGWNRATNNPSYWNHGLNKEAYLGSKELQDKAVVKIANNMISYGGKRIRPIIDKDFSQKARYIKMAHLVGPGAAVSGLLYGKDSKDGNNTSMLKYGKGAMENVPRILKAMGESSATVSTSTSTATPSAPPASIATPSTASKSTSTKSTSTKSTSSKSSSSTSQKSTSTSKKSNSSSKSSSSASAPPMNIAEASKGKKGSATVTTIAPVGTNTVLAAGSDTKSHVTAKKDSAKKAVKDTVDGKAGFDASGAKPSRCVIAAQYTTKIAKPRSTKRCAMFVRMGLQAAGYKFTPQPSAYQYWTNGTMEKMGFRKIPRNTPIRVGDVIVFNRNSASPHGHICIWNGKNWVSDFIQKSMWVGPSYIAANDYQLFRDPDGNGALASNESDSYLYANGGGSGAAGSTTPSVPKPKFKTDSIGVAKLVDSRAKDNKFENNKAWHNPKEYVHSDGGRDKGVNIKKPSNKYGLSDKEFKDLKDKVFKIKSDKNPATIYGDDKVDTPKGKDPTDKSKQVLKKIEVKPVTVSNVETNPENDTKKVTTRTTTESGTTRTDSQKGLETKTTNTKTTVSTSTTPIKPVGTKPTTSDSIKHQEKNADARDKAIIQQTKENMSILEAQLNIQTNILTELKNIRMDINRTANMAKSIPMNKESTKKSSDKSKQSKHSPKRPSGKNGPKDLREPVSLLK